MGRVVILTLRVVQFLGASANLVLASLIINWYLTRTPLSPPSSFNFLIFAPIFSLFSIAYLEIAPRMTPRATHPFFSLALEATNALFYFAGFIALAVFLSRILFCDGVVCAVGRATSPVAAAEFVAWIATTILLAKDIFKGGLRDEGGRSRPGALAARSRHERESSYNQQPQMQQNNHPTPPIASQFTAPQQPQPTHQAAAWHSPTIDDRAPPRHQPSASQISAGAAAAAAIQQASASGSSSTPQRHQTNTSAHTASSQALSTVQPLSSQPPLSMQPVQCPQPAQPSQPAPARQLPGVAV